MAIKQVYFAAGGAAIVIGAGAFLLLSTSGPSVDEGGNSLTRLNNPAPNIQTDMLDPVGEEEASRRATLNDQRAQEALQQPDPSYVAPPVISEEVNMGPDGPLSQRPPAALPLPAIQPLDPSEIKVPQPISIQRVTEAPEVKQKAEQERQRAQAEADRRNQLAQRVQGQVDQLLANNPQPAISIQGFKAPPKKEPATAGSGSGNGSAGAGGRSAPTGPIILAAKPGDVFYANLKVGFNSEDPRGLPVYATIIDQKANGSYGPLHGGVLAGNVTYGKVQAAVTFRQMTLRDGRTAPIQAMAATLDEVRPGVAATVDRHILSRYSGLLAGSLLQGLGTAGQALIENDRTTTLSDNFAVVSGPSSIDWAKVGLAAVQPLGENLSQIASQNFNRPATMASPAGTDVAIVFLQQVTIAESR